MTGHRLARRSAPWLVAVVLLAHPAAAQQSMSEVLSFLLVNRSVQTGDFAADERATAAAGDALSRALLVELATLPVSSAGGGFAYRMNPALGTFERVSSGFGPIFAERALTTGRHRVTLGTAFRWTVFDRLDGRDLRSGTLVTTANRFLDEAAPFDAETLALRVRASTLTVFTNVGLTERLDVGALLPIVALHIEGERWDTYRGTTVLQAAASASTSGPADMAVRAKYRLLGTGPSGMSAATELRLPTGSRDDLLGAGQVAVRALAIASLERGRLASHVNIGAAAGGVSREVDYRGAVTMAVTPRVTLVGEVMGRWLGAPGSVVDRALPHPGIADVETTRLTSADDGLHSAIVVAGARVNLTSTWLLAGQVLMPVTDGGLRAVPSPTVSLEYAFSP
jgi:hypothetical protein